MLEETRIVQIYIKAHGPDDPRFGDEIDDEAANDYAYDGWLPLALSPADKDGRRHATIVGDPWLTTPAGADAPPDPGAATVRISAAECSAELQERARLGLQYFVEETPEERGEPYDRNRIAENIAEEIETRLKAVNRNLAARTALCGAIDHVDHVEITIAGLKRVHTTTEEADPSALNEACHQMVSDFVATHHRELVAHIERRVRESRTRLRAVMKAGQRLGAFDD